jgi:hypothetical protein
MRVIFNIAAVANRIRPTGHKFKTVVKQHPVQMGICDVRFGSRTKQVVTPVLPLIAVISVGVTMCMETAGLPAKAGR